jgi:hypothetical protein
MLTYWWPERRAMVAASGDHRPVSQTEGTTMTIHERRQLPRLAPSSRRLAGKQTGPASSIHTTGSSSPTSTTDTRAEVGRMRLPADSQVPTMMRASLANRPRVLP